MLPPIIEAATSHRMKLNSLSLHYVKFAGLYCTGKTPTQTYDTSYWGNISPYLPKSSRRCDFNEKVLRKKKKCHMGLKTGIKLKTTFSIVEKISLLECIYMCSIK
ncbi:hypothetical protein X975_02763, partial [Stegodyphus mimosarum]